MSEELKGRALEYQVAGEETGTRLDLFLGEKLACSRGEVRRMLRSGLVRLDGKTVGERAKGAILSGGQRLELKDDRPASALEARPSPENPLTILAQGSGWLALDKGDYARAITLFSPGEQGEPGLELGLAFALGGQRSKAEEILDLHLQKPKETGPHPAVQTAAERIELGLSAEINIPDLCADIGISHNHLIRLFRKQYGVTIRDYIRQRRLSRAKHLLECSDQPIKEIAHDVGIPNPQYFNKCVRHAFGRSPRELRIG